MDLCLAARPFLAAANLPVVHGLTPRRAAVIGDREVPFAIFRATLDARHALLEADEPAAARSTLVAAARAPGIVLRRRPVGVGPQHQRNDSEQNTHGDTSADAINTGGRAPVRTSA